MLAFPYLSWAIWLPIAAGLIVLAVGAKRNVETAKWIALVGAVAGFLVTLPLYQDFKLDTGAMQFEELAPWISSFNINYHLGVDGISVWFVLLNSFMTILVVIAAWVVVEKKVAQYLAAFLIMSGLINGSFVVNQSIDLKF